MKVKIIIMLLLVVMLVMSVMVSCKSEETCSDFGLFANNFVEHEGWIYYSEFKSGDLYSIRLNGESKTRLGDLKTWSFDIYKNRIYYINTEEKNIIYSAELDGSDKKKITPSDWSETAVKYNGITAGWMHVADGWIYYIDESRVLKRIKTDGSEGFIISDKDESCSFLSVDNSWVYYISNIFNEETGNRICRIKTDDTREMEIGFENESGYAVDYDNEFIYYNSTEDDGIYKVSFDERQKIKLTDNSSDGLTLKVIGDWVYYYNKDKKGLYKVKTDGSKDIKITDAIYLLFINDVWDNWLIYWGTDELGVEDEPYIGMVRVSNFYKTDELIDKIIKDMTEDVEVRKYE